MTRHSINRGYRLSGRHGGFTMIELLVVLVIISILAAIAYPSYKDSVYKSRRSGAKAALMDLAARQEQYFNNNKTYADTLLKLGITNPITEGQWYTLLDPGTLITSGATVIEPRPSPAETSATARLRCSTNHRAVAAVIGA